MTPDKLKELRDRLANEYATRKVISTRLHQLHVENFELGWDACEKELQSQLAKANEKLERCKNALKLGLQCAIWQIDGPYGNSPDVNSVEIIRTCLKEISDKGEK